MVKLVARWTTDHYHLNSNLGVDISERCFIFDFFITFGMLPDYGYKSDSYLGLSNCFPTEPLIAHTSQV